jgi:hypothetical protein
MKCLSIICGKVAASPLELTVERIVISNGDVLNNFDSKTKDNNKKKY